MNNATYAVSQRFYFDAAHTLQRAIDSAGSRRIHGHTYHAEVSFCGTPDPLQHMVIDLGRVRAHIERVREMLDHHYLDEVPGLGTPTLENLCRFIAAQFTSFPAPLAQVRVWREALGDSCTLSFPINDS